MAPELENIFRSSVIYVAVLAGLRLAGKRHVAQLSILDLVLILLISNAVQNAMVGANTTLLGGIIAAATLIIVNYIFTLIVSRSKNADALIEGTPTLLVHNGSMLKKHLQKEKLTEEELERVIREHGIENVSDVKTAIMELDGTISVISKVTEERKIETFKHRRTKYQQRKI